jgi:hypothetical protein
VQAIENMLTMINQNNDGEFGGVMFMSAATPDCRTESLRSFREGTQFLSALSPAQQREEARRAIPERQFIAWLSASRIYHFASLGSMNSDSFKNIEKLETNFWEAAGNLRPTRRSRAVTKGIATSPRIGCSSSTSMARRPDEATH